MRGSVRFQTNLGLEGLGQIQLPEHLPEAHHAVLGVTDPKPRFHPEGADSNLQSTPAVLAR